jgi:hypothetical protein
MYRIYYFGFNNCSGTGIIFFPPLEKIPEFPLTTFATTTVTRKNHNNTSGNHTYT